MLKRKLQGATVHVMWRVLRYWTLFCLQAKQDCELPCVPINPHIGFLLAHEATATDLLYEIAKNTEPKSQGDLILLKLLDDLGEQMYKDLVAQYTKSQASASLGVSAYPKTE
jgi:hypothetical protein